MSNIYFSESELTNATNIIIEYLRDTGFTGSVEDGTGIADTIIKPNALLYSLYSQLIEKVSAYLSLQKATDMYKAGTLLADDYDAAVDNILANWFVTRKEGKPTYGTLRIWFLQPLDFLHFTDGEIIGNFNGHNLVVNEDQVFAESNFSQVVNATTNYNEYFVDVAVRSSDNFDDIIVEGDAGVAGRFSNVYYLRTSVPANFIPGISPETSEAFIYRTKQAITTRELITERAINTVLIENFDEILNIYTAGHGDPEQIRDIVTLDNGARVHYGNKADIYVASNLTKISQSFKLKTAGEIPINELPDNSHIGHILKCYTERSNGTIDGETSITNILVTEKMWNMAIYKPTAILVDAPEGSWVRLEYLYDPAIPAIQEFVYSDSQRIVCYDPQVKHKYPVVMRFNFTITLVEEEYREDSRTEATKAVVEYINGLARYNENYIESELITYIHQSVPNVKKVIVPLGCTATLFDPLHMCDNTIEVHNTFSISDFPEMSKQISANTVQMYTDSTLITVN